MSSESVQAKIAPSNPRRRKNAPRNSRPWEGRISFRDIARLASRSKTEQFLVDRTGCDGSTAKRWLSGRSRVPGDALRAVVVDILTRAEL